MLTLLRLMKTFARATVPGPQGDPYATHVTRWRVLPGDIDVFGHMNNARYPALMDIGRIDYLLRCGYFGNVVRQRWSVPVGAMELRFRSSLKPFERFELHTRLVHWDERWFHFRHDFVRPGQADQPTCTAWVKTLFVGRQGSVPSAVVVRTLAGIDLVSPPALDDAARAG